MTVDSHVEKEVAKGRVQHRDTLLLAHNRPYYYTKTLHVAPMLDVTTREFRALIRILSKRTVLWTEMVVDSTIVFAEDIDFHLEFDDNTNHPTMLCQHPIVCQLGGGCNTEWIRTATTKVLQYGYDEINLNLGCPSDKVAAEGKFGALLMKHSDVAVQALLAMMDATKENHTSIPVSVKCRIGVDDLDSLGDLVELIRRLHQQGGCNVFYLHARKAILGGLLSPSQNRDVPPLNYPRVYEVCRMFPQCDFYINGGIKTLKDAKDICYGNPTKSPVNEHCKHGQIPCEACNFANGSCVAPPSKGNAPSNLRGCLLGRVAMDNPIVFWDADRYFYGAHENPCQTRRQVLMKYFEYLERIYPRRCCDQDLSVTSKITDSRDFHFDYDYCHKCAPLFVVENEDIVENVSIAPPEYCAYHGKKITTHVLNRSVKPINNIFFGLSKSVVFRRRLQVLARCDNEFRNCGPSALIRRALLVLPSKLIDQELTPTEQQHFQYHSTGNSRKMKKSNQGKLPLLITAVIMLWCLAFPTTAEETGHHDFSNITGDGSLMARPPSVDGDDQLTMQDQETSGMNGSGNAEIEKLENDVSGVAAAAVQVPEVSNTEVASIRLPETSNTGESIEGEVHDQKTPVVTSILEVDSDEVKGPSFAYCREEQEQGILLSSLTCESTEEAAEVVNEMQVLVPLRPDLGNLIEPDVLGKTEDPNDIRLSQGSMSEVLVANINDPTEHSDSVDATVSSLEDWNSKHNDNLSNDDKEVCLDRPVLVSESTEQDSENVAVEESGDSESTDSGTKLLTPEDMDKKEEENSTKKEHAVEDNSNEENSFESSADSNADSSEDEHVDEEDDFGSNSSPYGRPSEQEEDSILDLDELNENENPNEGLARTSGESGTGLVNEQVVNQTDATPSRASDSNNVQQSDAEPMTEGNEAVNLAPKGSLASFFEKAKKKSSNAGSSFAQELSGQHPVFPDEKVVTNPKRRTNADQPKYRGEPWGQYRSTRRQPDLELLQMLFVGFTRQEYNEESYQIQQDSHEALEEMAALLNVSIVEDAKVEIDGSPPDLHRSEGKSNFDATSSSSVDATTSLLSASSNVNSDFVEGLDDIDKFFEGVDPPDELDVGASGLSIQEVIMGKGRQIFVKKVVQLFHSVQNGWKTLSAHIIRLFSGEDDQKNASDADVIPSNQLQVIMKRMWNAATMLTKRIVGIVDDLIDRFEWDESDESGEDLDFILPDSGFL